MEIGIGKKSNAETENFYKSYESSCRGFLKNSSGSVAEGLLDLKETAWKSFSAEGLPGPKNELFKYTNLKSIKEVSDLPPENVNLDDINFSDVIDSYKALNAIRLVFLNGVFIPSLSETDNLPSGLYCGPLSSLLLGKCQWVEEFLPDDELLEVIRDLSDYKRTSLEQLNRALYEEGAFVGISKNTKIDRPIHILNLGYCEGSKGPTWAMYPRNIIVALENSQSEIVESFVSLGEGAYFCNSLTEVKVSDGAKVEYLKSEEENQSSQHVSGVQALVGRDSEFNSFTLSYGSKISRTHCDVYLKGVGAGANVNGLYIGKEGQHIDNNTLIVHEKPNGYSRQLYKGILKEKSHGVFNGKIFIHQEAQKTDSAQMNKNLLLDKKAQVDTKPELEVYADDVKANHGSAVGQVDNSELFYFLSRGIDKNTALSMLSKGYANDVIFKINSKPLKQFVFDRVDQLRWFQ